MNYFCNFISQNKIFNMLLISKQNLKTRIFLLLFSIQLIFSVNCVYAQTDPEMQAKQLFSDGNFEQALPVFEDLIRLYPNDEELNYHLGASLAETGNFSETTHAALQIAVNKFPKAYYYLGQYFQANSDWENAEKSYLQFIRTANKKETNNTSVGELLEMCKKQINPFRDQEPEPTMPDSVLTPKSIISSQNPPLQTTTQVEIPQELKDTTISFQINSRIHYIQVNQFRNENSKQAFISGWKAEQELKTKQEQINLLRETYDTAQGDTKDSLASKIIRIEKEIYQLNQQARESYLTANEKEAIYWGNAGETEIDQFLQQTQHLKDSLKKIETATETVSTPVKISVIIPDTTLVKPSTEIPPTEGIITYKIQIGAYSKTPPDWVQRQFKKLSVIRRIDQYTDNNGVTVYTVGELKTYKDALQMQKQVKIEGIQKAIIAAYRDGERIHIDEALKITE